KKVRHTWPPWRNRLARSAVNRKVGGSRNDVIYIFDYLIITLFGVSFIPYIYTIHYIVNEFVLMQ
uniref:7TM_GPCR_Srx domain-containing protein n=1 Tax=Strongyloides papillosus TaxID=174720 RepID=A0A0N5C2K4_STREA